MKTKIKIHLPVFECKEKQYKKIKLNLSASLLGGDQTAEVEIDVNNLLPFINLTTSLVTDFFLFTASIYGIDRFIERRRNSVDGWSRDFEIEFPVRDISIWNSSKDQVENMLSFLTGDYWSLSFYQAKFDFPVTPLRKEFNENFTQVNLFSGGLDSLIGALDHLKSKPKEKILLVSHYDRKMGGPKKDQASVLKLLNPAYGMQFAHVPSTNISLENSTINKTETTSRSRSLLFSGMALILAQAKGISKIVVPENGSVSLNYPLSSSRRSACSTRTTHPLMLSFIANIWAKFSIKTSISNPYELKTKGEMVAYCKDRINLSKMVHHSNSCGKHGHRSYWDKETRSASHCAICMPCVYRRAALLSVEDLTTYGNDINLLSLKTGKGQDISALLNFLKRSLTKSEIKNELIVNGIKDLVKLDQYADLVIRTRIELKQYIIRYGNSAVKEKAGV